MASAENGKGMHPQMVAQWITSLAVSIICCAVLFIIFAGYIVQIHDETNLLSLKVALLDERNVRQAMEIERLRRGPSVQINTTNPQAVSVVPPENLVQPDASAPVMPPAATAATPADVMQPVPPQPMQDMGGMNGGAAAPAVAPVVQPATGKPQSLATPPSAPVAASVETKPLIAAAPQSERVEIVLPALEEPQEGEMDAPPDVIVKSELPKPVKEKPKAKPTPKPKKVEEEEEE